MACADTATDKAKPAIAINLIILHLPKPSDNLDFSQQGIVRPLCSSSASFRRRVEIDQGLYGGRAGSSQSLELRIRSFGCCGVGVRSVWFLSMNRVDQFGADGLFAEPRFVIAPHLRRLLWSSSC